MKALCWQGKEDVRVETVEDPKILNPHDAVVRITRTAICGSSMVRQFPARLAENPSKFMPKYHRAIPT